MKFPEQRVLKKIDCKFLRNECLKIGLTKVAIGVHRAFNDEAGPPRHHPVSRCTGYRKDVRWGVSVLTEGKEEV